MTKKKQTLQETIFDRRVTISKMRPLPALTRLCDQIAIKNYYLAGKLKLYYEVEGSGPPLVLINGGPGGTHHYFHNNFSKASYFSQVIYYDQRGCGLSGRATSHKYHINQLVDDLDRLRRHLHLKKWFVLGYSFGGLLAQCYAMKYPQRVAGLILVNSATDAFDLSLKPTRQYDFLSQQELKNIKSIYSNHNLTDPEQSFNAYLSGEWKRQGYHKPSMEELARQALYEWDHDPKFPNAIYNSCQNLSFEHAFDCCPLPILLMEGKWDLTWNTDKASKFAYCFPHAQLIKFNYSGHNPFDDEPDKFFATVKKFITNCPYVSPGKINKWFKTTDRQRKTLTEKIPAIFSDYSLFASRKISKMFNIQWISNKNFPILLRMGFALYDTQNYQSSIQVWLEIAKQYSQNNEKLIISYIWLGHLYDLIDQRATAIKYYTIVKNTHENFLMSHDQYGLKYYPSKYASLRIKEPFTRLDNILKK